jgi:hypothetical protein
VTDAAEEARDNEIGDLFRARLDQIINLKHELAQLAGAIDWDWIDVEIAPLYSEKGRPGIETRFAIGLLLLKTFTGCPTKAYASAGSMIRTSSTSPARSSSSTPSRALGPEPLEEAARRQAGAAFGREIKDILVHKFTHSNGQTQFSIAASEYSDFDFVSEVLRSFVTHFLSARARQIFVRS